MPRGGRHRRLRGAEPRRTSSCATPCGTSWPSAWRTSACRRTPCAGAWPRWRTSSASSRGSAVPSTGLSGGQKQMVHAGRRAGHAAAPAAARRAHRPAGPSGREELPACAFPREPRARASPWWWRRTLRRRWPPTPPTPWNCVTDARTRCRSRASPRGLWICGVSAEERGRRPCAAGRDALPAADRPSPSATPMCATRAMPPGCCAAATSTCRPAPSMPSSAATAAASRRSCARPPAC